MDEAQKKTALRMIPYGIYVMTTEAADGTTAAATVNWVTQTSFQPPLVAVGVKVDSHTYEVAKAAGHFALNMLGKGQQGQAFTFFKPATREGMSLSGEAIRAGETGQPVLEHAIAHVECRIVEIVERGDHHVVLGEVVAAAVLAAPEGRADAAILEMKDLGANVYYGG